MKAISIIITSRVRLFAPLNKFPGMSDRLESGKISEADAKAIRDKSLEELKVELQGQGEVLDYDMEVEVVEV